MTIMGASRTNAQPGQTMTAKEIERSDWVAKQRGKEPDRKAGQIFAGAKSGLPGLFNFVYRDATPFRNKETRDWIDQQRGVSYERTGNSLFGALHQNRQRREDRDSWIDEQIRKGREEEEAKKISAANQPMTQDERRGYLNREVESRKDIWD
jgi:hypothetical protein